MNEKKKYLYGLLCFISALVIPVLTFIVTGLLIELLGDTGFEDMIFFAAMFSLHPVLTLMGLYIIRGTNGKRKNLNMFLTVITSFYILTYFLLIAMEAHFMGLSYATYCWLSIVFLILQIMMLILLIERVIYCFGRYDHYRYPLMSEPPRREQT